MILVTVTAMGTLVGSRSSGRAAAPALTLGVFAVLFGLSFAKGRLAAFSVVFPATFYQPWFEPHAVLVSGQIALIGSSLLMALAGLLRGRARPVLAAIGALGVATAVAALLRTDPNPVQIRRAPAEAACDSRGTVTLCVWPQSERALSPGLESLARFVTAARPFLDVPHAYRQPGLNQPPAAVTVLLPSETRTPRDAALYTSLAVLSHYECARGSGARAAADLFTWLAARVDASTADVTSPGFRIAQAPTAVQQKWVSRQVAAIHAC